MFRRRRAQVPAAPSPDGPRDAVLTVLSAGQADALVRVSLRWFADTGRDAAYDGNGVIRCGGTSYGLFNLAVAVRDRPWRAWPELVADHYRTVLAADAHAGPLTWDGVYLKLRRGRDIGDVAGPDYDATSPLPGVYALFAHDTPDAVRELLRVDDVTALGELAAVRARALANLRELPQPEHGVVPTNEQRTDADLHVFNGEDYFVASRVLVLPELLAGVLGVEAPEHGCLVAVPNRHLLVVHLVSGLGVLSAVNALAAIAEGEFTESAGAVSDEVYFLPPHGGAAESVVLRGEDGAVNVMVEGAFAETFRRLGLIG